MAASTTIRRPSFSELLRERSWHMHQEAEGATFMKALMKGEIDRSGYERMTVQHYFIYDALERVGCELRDNPVVAPFLTSRLDRVPSLRADLEALLGPAWERGIRPLPATARYVQRIRDMASWPGGYIAHHYTRYLGDLSGGLAIGAVVTRVYGLEEAGASFYRFDLIDKPKLFKDEYRATLDAGPWDVDEQDRMIDEVLYAYRLNTDVFADLGRVVGLHA